MSIEQNIEKLYSIMDSCELCPRRCGARRNRGEKGLCKTADKIFIASANVHHGEEPPISASRGSGTIFFSNCALSCAFCQNYPISQLGNGKETTLSQLVEKMLSLQDKGVHNINFVTPTHYSAHIAKAVFTARQRGLEIPVLWNTGGYERAEIIKLLEGIVDIYLPDIKYSGDDLAFKYSGVRNYVENNRAALKEMLRQAGNLVLDANGAAKRGIIVRHLVLPGNVLNTKGCLDFIAQNLSRETFLSLMSQYHFAYNAGKFDELKNGLTTEEYDEAADYMRSLGLENGWTQEI